MKRIFKWSIKLLKNKKVLKIEQNYPKNNKIYTQLTNLLNN